MKINHHQFSMNSTERDRRWDEDRRHFKDYCVNRFQWFNYPKWGYVAPFPLHVDFESSFRCNLNCPMCFRPFIEKKNYGDMDFALFKKGIDESAEHGLYSIRLSWRGEATLNPNLIDMVVYAKNKGIKEVSFITNGSKLTPEFSRELVRAGLDYVTVSVDGLKKHYDHNRQPMTYEQITANIAGLYELKNALGNGFPKVKIQGIWTYMKEAPEEYYRHFESITDNISYDAEDDYSQRTLEQDPAFICQYPWQRLTVTWEGIVPACISDWDVQSPIGDLRNQSLYDIWHGKVLEEQRCLQLTGRRPEIKACAVCHRPDARQLGDYREGKLK